MEITIPDQFEHDLEPEAVRATVRRNQAPMEPDGDPRPIRGNVEGMKQVPA